MRAFVVGVQVTEKLTTHQSSVLCPQEGGIAQLGEHLLCKQGVVGSIPSASTRIQRTEDRRRSGAGAPLWSVIRRLKTDSLSVLGL